MKTENIFDIERQDCINYVNSFTNKAKFVKDFRISFDYILSYHATNLNEQELNDIKKNGLRPSNRELLHQKALDRFIKKDDSIELQNNVRLAVKEYISKKEYLCENEINLGLIKEPFITEFYHYLLFGPETLLGLASELNEKHSISFRKRMIEFGSHYIIHAKVPVKNTKEQWINCIYEYLNNGFPGASLVYHKNLPAEFLTIEQTERPYDRKFFAGM